MEYKTVSLPSPENPGVMVDALDIPVTESIERWSELHLADGSIFRVKVNVISVARLVNKVDANGKPIYVINGQPAVAMIASGKESSPGGNENA